MRLALALDGVHADVAQILLFGCGEVALIGSRVDTVVKSVGAGVDEIADLREGQSRDAVNRRTMFVKPQIELRGLDASALAATMRRLRRLDLGLGGEIGLDGVVEILLGDGFRFG